MRHVDMISGQSFQSPIHVLKKSCLSKPENVGLDSGNVNVVRKDRTRTRGLFTISHLSQLSKIKFQELEFNGVVKGKILTGNQGFYHQI